MPSQRDTGRQFAFADRDRRRPAFCTPRLIMDCDGDRIPPWAIATLHGVAADHQAIGRGSASETGAIDVTSAIAEPVAGVLVDRTMAIRSWIDVEPEGSDGALACILDERLAGNDRAGAHENGQDPGLGGDLALQKRLARILRDLEARPVVVPSAGRQGHCVRRGLLTKRGRRDEQIGTPHELARRRQIEGRARHRFGNSMKRGRIIGTPVREASSARV